MSKKENELLEYETETTNTELDGNDHIDPENIVFDIQNKAQNRTGENEECNSQSGKKVISKKTIIIAVISVVLVIAIVLGLVFGLRGCGNSDNNGDINGGFDGNPYVTTTAMQIQTGNDKGMSSTNHTTKTTNNGHTTTTVTGVATNKTENTNNNGTPANPTKTPTKSPATSPTQAPVVSPTKAPTAAPTNPPANRVYHTAWGTRPHEFEEFESFQNDISAYEGGIVLNFHYDVYGNIWIDQRSHSNGHGKYIFTDYLDGNKDFSFDTRYAGNGNWYNNNYYWGENYAITQSNGSVPFDISQATSDIQQNNSLIYYWELVNVSMFLDNALIFFPELNGMVLTKDMYDNIISGYSIFTCSYETLMACGATKIMSGNEWASNYLKSNVIAP